MIERPLLIFDGDCGFCRFWVARWRHRTGDRVEYQPYQNPDVARRVPHISAEQFARAVHFIEPDGQTSTGALAVYRLLALTGRRDEPWTAMRWAGAALVAMYRDVPGVATVSDRAYRLVADHRPFFGQLTTLLWGRATAPSTYATAGWLFRRLLGVVYLVAFWSLARQLPGLVGHDGVLPARSYMDAARAWVSLDHVGLDRFRLLPTIFWSGVSDGFIQGVCFAGVMGSALLIIGVAPMLTLPLIWLAYLSLSVIGQQFLSYQWDALLLETGFLAIVMAPGGLRDRRERAVDPPRLGVGLLLWLLFRLMVGSGASKLASGDPSWRGLTALSFHYETQPIPTPVAWFAHHLPMWFSRVSTALVLGVELFVPFLIVAPRRLRLLASALLVSLQLLIALTGNYAFFNLLAVLPCLFLIDDTAMASLGTSWRQPDDVSHEGVLISPARRFLLIAVAVVTLPVSAMRLASSADVDLPVIRSVATPLAEFISPFRSVNQYGLFAVMTTARPEIVIEGSDDGVGWKEYEFPYKPGDVHRRPPWVAPFQPRLDWEMWFAALSTHEREVWFENLCDRLLEGTPAVLDLFARDPFDGRRPRYVRAMLYRYRFSSAAERAKGIWWSREPIAEYLPARSLSTDGSGVR